MRLHASLTPEILGQGTTIGFGFQVLTLGIAPAPLTKVEVRYPIDLGIALSGLGIATCNPSTLEDFERNESCPPDSRMGYGTALAQLPVGSLTITETARIAVFRAPTQSGHLALLFYAEGKTPISAEIVFPGLLLPAQRPFGGVINLDIPPIIGLPGSSNVAVTKLTSTIGPQNITYYEHVRGKTIAYRPKGVLLPDRCPSGGFPFAALFTFEDGTSAGAHTVVPCPLRQIRGRPQRAG